MPIANEINAQAPLLHALLAAGDASAGAMRATVVKLKASPNVDGKTKRALPKVVKELDEIIAGYRRLKEVMHQAGFGTLDTSRGGGGDGG